jgi:hypothetical protein
MIESGMSLSHMKTNVTIVSHGRVSLVTRLVPTASAASGTGTVFGRMAMGVCGCTASTTLATGFGSCSREFSQQQRVQASKLRSTTYTRPAARTQSEVASGYRPYVASTDAPVLAA